MPELVRGGIHTLIKENVYTITKVFDKRVRDLINIIIKGKNSPMLTLNYHYRIEFQSRGAGHAHGVLWLDLPELDVEFPGIKAIFKSIKNDLRFNDTQIAILQKFIPLSFQADFISSVFNRIDRQSVVTVIYFLLFMERT